MGKSEILKSSNHNLIGTIDTFSHNLKHPYLALSPDCRTVTKNSHPGIDFSIYKLRPSICSFKQQIFTSR